MTKKEFLTAVAELENEELSNYAAEELEKMEEQRAKRKEAASKTRIENEQVAAFVFDSMDEEPMTATDIAEKFGLKSPQKATAIMKILVADGRVEKVPVKRGQKKYVGYVKV